MLHFKIIKTTLTRIRFVVKKIQIKTHNSNELHFTIKTKKNNLNGCFLIN